MLMEVAMPFDDSHLALFVDGVQLKRYLKGCILHCVLYLDIVEDDPILIHDAVIFVTDYELPPEAEVTNSWYCFYLGELWPVEPWSRTLFINHDHLF